MQSSSKILALPGSVDIWFLFLLFRGLFLSVHLHDMSFNPTPRNHLDFRVGVSW